MPKKLWFLFVIFLFIAPAVLADEPIYSAADGLGADGLSGIDAILEGFSFRDAAATLGRGGDTTLLQNLWQGICRFVGEEVQGALSAPLLIAGLAVLSGLLGNLQLSEHGTGEAVFFLVYALIVGLAVTAADNAATLSESAAQDMATFTNAALPSLAVLSASSGGVFSAAVHPMLLGAMSAASLLVSRVGIPAMYISMALSVVGNLSNKLPLSTLAAFFKKTALWLVMGSFTLFSAVLTVSGYAAGSLDGVTLKGVKYAASTLVPMLGNLLAETAEAVSYSALHVKNAAGAAGMLLLLLLTLYPVLKIMIVSLLYRLAAAVTEPVSDKRITASITGISDALSGIGAMTAALGVLSILVIGLMVRFSQMGVVLG